MESSRSGAGGFRSRSTSEEEAHDLPEARRRMIHNPPDNLGQTLPRRGAAGAKAQRLAWI
jgi:hypothetical protein